MTRTAISVDHIARVEGHGNVHLSIKDGAVETCEMNVVEPARLFESMVVGRKFADVPYIASRVCGICSASHVITDILAIERIFGVEVTDRTRALRELLVYGSYLKKDVNVVSSARNVVVFSTLAAVLSAMVVVPAVFAFGLPVQNGRPVYKLHLQ